MNLTNLATKVAYFTIAAAALCSCSFVAPKASPKDAEAVLSRAASYKTARRTLGASKESRVPLRRGQWVATLLKARNDPNDVTLQIMKLAEVQGSTVTIETEQYSSTNGGKRMVMQQRLRNFPTAPRLYYRESDITNALRDVEVDSIKVMDDQGTVQQVPQLGLPIGRLGVDLLKTNVATGDVRSEPCESSAIKASKCYVVPFSMRVLWVSDKGTTSAHSDIPIVGFVRSDSEVGVNEVIGFGSSGASILIK